MAWGAPGEALAPLAVLPALWAECAGFCVVVIVDSPAFLCVLMAFGLYSVGIQLVFSWCLVGVRVPYGWCVDDEASRFAHVIQITVLFPEQ